MAETPPEELWDDGLDEGKPESDGVRRTPRCTVEERESRIEFAAGLLGMLWTDGDVKRALQKRYGLKHSQCTLYISRARALVKKWSKTEAPEALAQAKEMMQALLRRPKMRPIEIVAVFDRFTKLFGLNAPEKTETRYPDGPPPVQIIEAQKPPDAEPSPDVCIPGTDGNNS